ncbi:U3 small nucleolar RNA-associated protein 12, putative [Plasmodium berghei]|uniref:U3 small nucleolar RNA-associated protein 12, putative n=2 Tax=Plasmodium berghei TaxID=5821 RepID=A0A509AQ79_PLABA|nr:U3 small nucleolar RNA-associated protein 12, putative [Plasmodium berghei ANKA]CXI90500.1 U3 small nucleolar RNA-associated protein 12, putative [Plasmodium berghei]SCL96258.1 U3 small nucleolar RNA-associated protein 12, putative [Plasmodium berghei]SCM16393.1 U3 small nucleolar RNA-associated protein 12, putative [Plasmodium berghei]SCN27614.1 U3 small nucleolar RNA-associated protein 12, putative [Plasmodium berghei]VUC57499.1 U3 small nucleolar RNA-associated protein 12, putative [Plas|eukprot:XP_034423270.1 U3 small nucleolar RNA-associated protein 12, putative [Plasmodium berghei ANKA]
MVKSYDRYEFEDCFGIVNSRSSNCIFFNTNHILTGHDEEVSLWNIQEKEIKKKMTIPFVPPYYFFTYHVTYMCLSEKNKNILAVGYMNGSIRLFDIFQNKILSTFSGHTSAICKLKFNKGNYLCSCSKDTNIILWDIVNDKGMYKLEGHTNAVNDIEFLEIENSDVDNFINNNLLVSASKDGLIKLWDLNIQMCVQTIVDCEDEINCLVVNETNTRLIVACNNTLRIYKIDLFSNIKDKFTNSKIYISFLSVIKRSNNCKIVNMKICLLVEDNRGQKPEDIQLLMSQNEESIDDLINNEQTNGNNENSKDIEQEKKINILNNSLDNTNRICNRTSYSINGDNNGILICCSNLKKIEIYKINSIQNQKKSEKKKKKRYIAKLKKKKNDIINEQTKILKFKGKTSIDYINITQKLNQIEYELSIHNKYDIHTVKDEIKYVFHYTCKYKLQNIDIYKKRKTDTCAYLLVSYTTNSLNVFQINLFDILNNQDMFILKKDESQQGINSLSMANQTGEEKEDENDEEKEDENDEEKEDENDEEKEDENDEDENDDDENDEDENGEKNELTEKIVEKVIYDYSKCLKEICQINNGHSNSVDFINLSENNEYLISICKKCVKIWNLKNYQNIITLKLEGCTSAIFCEQDEYIIISNDVGEIMLYELKNIELKYIFKVHANKIITLCQNPKQKMNFLSVGMENYLKIFRLINENTSNNIEGKENDKSYLYNEKPFMNNKDEDSSSDDEKEKINSNKNTIRFKEIDYYNLTDKVSCAMYSPNGQYICIGYLNNLIEVLYSDTLKLHLTLYGHSLPITCMDISKDNKILASSSSDKFLFIWNLEYGSINKRLHINCDVLTKIKFFNETNNLISISSDGYIKMWDAIKFQCICTIDGRFGNLTSLIINLDDNFFITSGSHKSIRCWKRGDDLIFLEEEKEKELNLEIEKEATRNDLSYPSSIEKNVILNKATIKTIEVIKSSEKLIEYLDIVEEEITLLETYYKNLTEYQEAKIKNELPNFVEPPNKPNSRPELLNQNPYEFIVKLMCNIKNNILNEILISLPFAYAYKLLIYMKTYLMSFYFFQKIQENYNKYLVCGSFNFHVEYVINIILSIINIYRNQFLFDTNFRFLLYELHQLIIPNLKKNADICTFNQTTLNFLSNAIDDDEINDELNFDLNSKQKEDKFKHHKIEKQTQ